MSKDSSATKGKKGKKKLPTFLSDIIRQRRTELSISLEELAFQMSTVMHELGGVGPTNKQSLSFETIRAWELGRAFPRANILPVLAGVLQIEIADFYS